MNINIYIEHCCGCGECSSICPKNAIHMARNFQGFYYPEVDKTSCVDCSLCVKHCSFNLPLQNLVDEQNTYIVKHKDESVRRAARSGGIFSPLSDCILEAGGTVYGAVMQNTVHATHKRAENNADCQLLHGSKYIQSEIFDCFDAVKDDLSDGKWVLFSGTACQVNAISEYCKDIDCSKLLLVDIVCHGVPSNRVWEDYLQWISEKLNKKIIAIDFRDKKNFGWEAHVETVTFEDGTTYSCDYFKELFYAHYILRDSCFDCPYKSLQRIGDITLADCWGIKNNAPDFDDDKGVSLVLVNSEKGRDFFKRVEEYINYRKVNIEDYLQPPLMKNWEKPLLYNKFWQEYNENGFYNTYRDFFCKQLKPEEKKEQKKAGILTFHFAHNCGAVLQAYALVSTVKKFRDCEVIDYQPEYHASWGNYRYHYEYPPTQFRRIWRQNSNKIRGLLSMIFHAPQIMLDKKYLNDKKRTETYEKFIREFLPVSPLKRYWNEVADSIHDYDLLISGSDQIWNPRIKGGKLDDVYLLPYDDTIKKYSYAASAGGDWTDADVAQIAFRTDKFQCISVREPDLAMALKHRNINTRIDIDPSLLLDQEAYYHLEKKAGVKGEYVFIYAFQISDELIQTIQFLKEKWNCTFVSYPFQGKLNNALDFDIVELDPMGPSEFLWLMHHAKYVITSTFHGLAYATVYRKPFVCLEPEHGKTRIDHFLSLFGLENCYYKGTDQLNYNPDYTLYNTVLDSERKKAIDYIESICK